MTPKCPKCSRPVLKVVRSASVITWVHAQAGRDGKTVYGCSESTVTAK